MVALRGIEGGAVQDPGAGVVAAAAQLGAGRLVVLVDRAADSAYLVASGTVATTEGVATMAAYGRGVLRVAMPPDRIADLGLAAFGDGLHAPVDLVGHDRPGNHRGRAATVRGLAHPRTRAPDFTSPGHVFPVVADPGGCLGRAGVAEAAADLARIVSRTPIAAYTAAVDETGGPADRAAGARLARVLGLEIVTVDAVVAYRERVEPAVERVVGIDLPTRDGPLSAVAFLSLRHGREYTAFVRGTLERRRTRVHVHLTCRPADVFGGGACGCGAALVGTREEIAALDDGIVIHVEHPDPFRHVTGATGDPVPPGIEVDVAHILRQLCVRTAVLSSNEPLDLARIAASGLVTRPAPPLPAPDARRAAG